MSSFNTPSLLKSEEETIRLLQKSVRATRYDDPLDQDAFLIASACTILQFSDQYTAFTANPELSECIFSIRKALHQNNFRPDSTCSEVLTAISDFAGEIVRSRQLFCDCQRAQATRLHAEEAAEALAACRDALAYAEKKRVLSPDSDTVSIPSNDEDTPLNKDPIPSPIEGADATMIASPARVRSSALLSPLLELESLMLSIRLTSPALVLLASPSSPTQSLPDLVPIYPPSSGRPSNSRDWPQKVMHALRHHQDHIIIVSEFSAAQGDSYLIAHTRNPGAPHIRASTPPSEPKLHRRLANVEAEVQQLATAQKHLREQLQPVQKACEGKGKASDP
ncbi:hypothetical protein B0H17DRAFT_1191864 [Mycena rosella]|uniref:Uncharacterized protein n=1 Tax=Mycena rosella TaxID=1033263 RepID=A0AAD7GX95_MYCRO|nr:hypothetical protein B0H17DRAFT_1191864 [Mycena rosella]